jgi:hypothetical protein
MISELAYWKPAAWAHTRSFLADARGQFEAVHPGHHNIGEQGVDFAGIPLRQFQGFLAIRR